MASQQYVTIAELENLALPADAFAGASDPLKNSALKAASALASSHLKKRYGLPLVQWGDDLKLCVASIAAYFLMKRRGFNPQSGADAIIVTGYRDQIGEPGRKGWLERVASGDCELDDVIDTTASIEEASPLVDSNTAQFDRGMFGIEDDDSGCTGVL